MDELHAVVLLTVARAGIGPAAEHGIFAGGTVESELGFLSTVPHRDFLPVEEGREGVQEKTWGAPV